MAFVDIDSNAYILIIHHIDRIFDDFGVTIAFFIVFPDDKLLVGFKIIFIITGRLEDSRTDVFCQIPSHLIFCSNRSECDKIPHRVDKRGS